MANLHWRTKNSVFMKNGKWSIFHSRSHICLENVSAHAHSNVTTFTYFGQNCYLLASIMHPAQLGGGFWTGFFFFLFSLFASEKIP